MENENTEIIFECRSLNNKNVRANELKILEKRSDELYFVFGENDVNVKKRYYEDRETLNEDFEELKKIKQKLENEKKQVIKAEPDEDLVERKRKGSEKKTFKF